MLGITKQQQTKKLAQLKEKPFKSKEYLSYLHNSGKTCIVCGDANIQIHHIKEYSSDSRDDRYVIPLCAFHHIYSDYLSPHGAPKKWRKAYPIEVQKKMALKIYNEFLKSKIV